MKSKQSILKAVLAEIKPTAKEEKEVNNKVNEVVKKLEKLPDVKIHLGGSGAKGTWLRNSYDADVFILFDYNKYKDKSSELSNILESNIKKIFPKFSRLHGSRDYFQIEMDGFTVELVPILSIKKANESMNITDISPLHTAWVNKNNYKDDIRLAKQFCKANRCYGAESYINGFSGYICEILTIHYKGFMNLIKNASKWTEGTVIDTKKYYKNKTEVMMSINKSKLSGPLIIVDPVQKERNAAAALSLEKFNIFVDACRKFLKKPSIDFFILKNIDKGILRNKNKKDKLIIIDVEAPEGKEDIVGCKIIKNMEKMISELKRHDFKLKEYGYEWDKERNAFYYFFFDKKELSKEKDVSGPTLDLKQHVENFKKSHKKTFVKQGRIYATDKRRYIVPEVLIKDFDSILKIKDIEVR